MMYESVIAYIVTGIVAGSLSGLLGIGGGIIIVPALAWIFMHFGFPGGHVMHVALGTSLAIIIFSTASSLLGHLKHRVSFWDIYRQLLIGVIIGTIIGALVSKFLSSEVLTRVFGVFALLMSVKMFFNPDLSKEHHLPGRVGMSIAGTVIGVISGLLGLGTGVSSVPFLTYCAVDMRRAVVVSAASGMTVAIVGTITYIITGWHVAHLPAWHVGYVYLPALLGVAVSSVVFARIGAYVSHKVSMKGLRIFFACLLLVIGVHMLF
jgi:uncharacterized protein